jgi:hypothetical protein
MTDRHIIGLAARRQRFSAIIPGRKEEREGALLTGCYKYRWYGTTARLYQ